MPVTSIIEKKLKKKKVTFQILTTCIVLTDEYSEEGTVIQYVKDNGGHCYFSPDGGGVANSG